LYYETPFLHRARKENFFSLVFSRVLKRVPPPPPPGALVIKQLFLAREQKNSGKKFFLFIGHEVLFYEKPFLYRARRNYVCGAIRKQSEDVSSSGGSSLEFWD
jgi:hypothetical protein